MIKQKEIPRIHIGYAKSGSTTLQKQLFNRHPQVNYLGVFPTANIGIDSGYLDEDCVYLRDENLRVFYRNLVKLAPSDYHHTGNQILFDEHITQYLTKPGIPLFSNERFTSVFFAYPNLKEKAHRLKTIFPEAKILLIIRNQLDLIVSQYRDHPFDPSNLAKGLPVSIDDWIEITFNSQDDNFLDSLKYDEIVEIYIRLFGKENVKILLLEELSKNVDTFAEQLSKFLGIDAELSKSLLQEKHENRGVSKTYNIYRTWKRRFELSVKSFGPIPSVIKRNYIKLDRLISKKTKIGKRADYLISEFWNKELSNYYRHSNQNLRDQFMLDLTKYKYPL